VRPSTTIAATTTAAISTTTATTAAGYVLVVFICIFWRALAPFAFFLFGGHRSYFCNFFVGGFGS
jgi:hypothetical protein